MEPPASVVHIESASMSHRKKTVIDILRESSDFVSGEAISATSRRLPQRRSQARQLAPQARLPDPGHLAARLQAGAGAGVLSMSLVAELTRECALGRSFRYYDEIESTNAEAKALAREGAPEGTVVISEAPVGRAWPPRTALDLSGRKGPALLGDPAARHADERRPHAHAGGSRSRR